MKNVIITSFIFIFSLFFVSDVKAAVTDDMFFVSYNGYVNGGSYIYRKSTGITSNSKVVSANSGVSVTFDINFQSDLNLIGQNYFLQVDICTGMPNYSGVTNSGYFTGAFQYNSHPYHKVNELGSCQINGNDAYLTTDIYVFSIKSLTSNTEEGGFVGSGSVGSAGGSLTPSYATSWQISNVSILDYDLNFLNQLEQQQTQNETNDKLDDITDMDIPDSSKEDLDDSSYQDYQGAEDDLMDSVGEADLSNVDIAIDTDSSNFIWDTITDIFQSHPLIMSTVIAILSIGIIKLALGR